MTNAEMKAMLGVEFDYVVDDSVIKSYVKAFDPEIGLTLSSLSDKTDDGKVIKESYPWGNFEDDGTVCVAAYTRRELMEQCLTIIKETGKYGPRDGETGGTPQCNFS